jgi:organic radical activating enzyme
MENGTPWPIEVCNHPFGSRKKGADGTPEKCDPSEGAACCEGLSTEQITSTCFENPRLYRDMVLKEVAVTPIESFEGGSVFYMWLNKVCPVGCEFCFFNSPTNCKDQDPAETEITDEGIEKLIKITEDGKIDKFVISGGGEPMMSREKVGRLASQLNVETLTIVTSSFWSRNPEKTDKYLTELRAQAESNPHHPKLVVRLSLDKFHLGRLAHGKGFSYVENLINWFSANAPSDPNFSLLIHTMEGDQTVDELLADLPVESIDDNNEYLNRKRAVTLNNGLKFKVEYSQIFDSNPHVDLRDAEQQLQNKDTFKAFLDHRRKGNMSLSFHGEDQPKGVYFLMLYDGTIEIWGASAPDVEASVYKDDYRAIVDKNLKDIVTLAALEKGPIYMQQIVAEVDPQAVTRAVGAGLRDFYSRLLMEEDILRLYVSIRLMQEYIAEGRIKPEEVEAWPSPLKAMVQLDKEKLKATYLESPSNIVEQYLADPNISTKKLLSLYEYVRLGHYAVTPEQMMDQIEASSIDEKIKAEFFDAMDKHQSLQIG